MNVILIGRSKVDLDAKDEMDHTSTAASTTLEKWLVIRGRKLERGDPILLLYPPERRQYSVEEPFM